MQTLLSNPTFVVYALTCVVLCLNLMFLWGYSGGVRGKTKTAINVEDTQTISKGAQLSDSDPSAVARVLRAHRNAEASIYPFFALGLVFVLVGGGELFAKVLFGVFTGARLLHSVVYLAGKQPWRSLTFAIGFGCLLVLAGDIVYLIVK